jgi:hypothetical protein
MSETELPTLATEYREITRFVGYRFGSDGSVWSRWRQGAKGVLTDSWTFLKGSIDKDTGYRSVTLKTTDPPRKTPFLVHRLILEAFVGPCPPGLECRHYPDRDKLNCRIDNLHWGTHTANQDDKIEHGTDPVGERNGRAKLDWLKVAKIRDLRQRGMMLADIAARYSVSRSLISQICRGEKWAFEPRPDEERDWTVGFH